MLSDVGAMRIGSEVAAHEVLSRGAKEQRIGNGLEGEGSSARQESRSIEDEPIDTKHTARVGWAQISEDSAKHLFTTTNLFPTFLFAYSLHCEL